MTGLIKGKYLKQYVQMNDTVTVCSTKTKKTATKQNEMLLPLVS